MDETLESMTEHLANKAEWDNFDVSVPNRRWTYTFDTNTILLNDVETIGVASNNGYGITRVVLLRDDSKEKFVYND